MLAVQIHDLPATAMSSFTAEFRHEPVGAGSGPAESFSIPLMAACQAGAEAEAKNAASLRQELSGPRIGMRWVHQIRRNRRDGTSTTLMHLALLSPEIAGKPTLDSRSML